MKTSHSIAVLGGGRWGTAMGAAFAAGGNKVTLWARDRAVVESICVKHENTKYFKGMALPPTLTAQTDLGKTLRENTLLVNAVPTQSIRECLAPYKEALGSKILVNTSKGIEQKTHLLVHQIFEQIASKKLTYVVLSGPSFASEVICQLPTAVTVASSNDAAAEAVQTAVSSPFFRAYTHSDVIGVELGGALKNIIAIAAGICEGLKLGNNAQAAIINRGMGEIVRLGRKMGAQPLTFLGLSGMGDLILTCTGDQSRNRRLGIALGQGKTLAEVQNSLGGVAEGYYTTAACFELTRKLGIDMPICQQIYEILYQGSTPKRAVQDLMGRDLKDEWEM